VIEKVLNATILEEVEVLPYEVEDYYETNIDSYRFSDDVVKADHILITNATMSDTEALEVAEMVSSRARTGENFTFLVERFSEDPTASLNDGNLGYFSKGEMVPQFEQAVFELEVGEISDPITTEFGYHVVRITDIKSAGELRPLSDVYDSIHSDLLTERQQKAVEAYIAELWDEAEIEYMDTEIRPKEVPSDDNNETDPQLGDDSIVVGDVEEPLS
ncbi:MAG: peptidylprolyl isomerase, partial [Nanoarchaeota archaeon]